MHCSGVILPDGEHRDLWIRDGRITFEPVPGAETVTRSGWIVPGLVDAHCHVGLSPAGHADPAAQRAQAYADRDAGALLLRDAGSPVDTRWLDEVQDAPRLIRAGRHLARTRRYIRDLAIELEPAQLPEEIAHQAARGDGWVKIVGDWIDRSLGDLAPEWPRETIFAAVRRAHAAGARIAVHTFGEEALPDLIEAGVDSIEHGTGLTEDLLPLMAERGTALVPTLINIDNFPSIADSATKFPTYAARMRRLHGSSRARLRAAYEAGVPIYAGTDAGSMLEHGRIVEEVRALHEAGMSAVDALGAASWRSREWLGLPGIEEGAPADLVVYDADPRADLAALVAPSRIVLKGRLVR
ncbi:MAG TPA: amidohydrolase family protein [Mycobacteriales bacterium]|nr:amidohydrolase family protein [Mycobacteriales bacterium]